MEERAFFAVLTAKVGEYGPEVLRPAVEISGRALGAMLAAHGSRAVADRVPDPVAEHVRAGLEQDPRPLDAIYQSIADATGLRLGVALELAHSIFTQVSEHLDAKTRAELRARLPDPWCTFFIERERYRGHAPVEHVETGKGHTLATGHPGSDHPLSDAHAEAQRGSIVTSDDPHADTKLASTTGLTQERRGESLATGKPGEPSRPVSGSSD